MQTYKILKKSTTKATKDFYLLSEIKVNCQALKISWKYYGEYATIRHPISHYS